MYLIYINELGIDYKGQHQYEFIFGESIDLIEDEWFIIPSSGRSVPPSIENIHMVGLLKNSDLVLDLVQNSDYFGMIDAVDGIVALGWEPFDIESEEQPKRISFHYGEHIESVKEKLDDKSIKIIIEKIKK